MPLNWTDEESGTTADESTTAPVEMRSEKEKVEKKFDARSYGLTPGDAARRRETQPGQKRLGI